MAFNWNKITGDTKQFIKTPLAVIMLLVLMALGWKDCDDERKADKKLMQEILFQQQLNDKLKKDGK